MNRMKRLLPWLCVVFCVFSCVGCKQEPESKPLLKVITSSQVGGTIFSIKHYYIVYDNGETKKTSTFEPSDSTSHRFVSTNYDDPTKLLSGIDINTEEGLRLNKIAESILLLTHEDVSISSPGAMYIVNEKIYFSTTVNRGNTGSVALFEYVELDNSIKKTATFKGDITHVEAY